MNVLGQVIYAVGFLMAIIYLIGIRTFTAKGEGATAGHAITTMLFIVALIVVRTINMSPLHLLWLFPASIMSGLIYSATFQRKLFPFYYLSFPAQIVSYIACIGLDHEKCRNPEPTNLNLPEF